MNNPSGETRYSGKSLQSSLDLNKTSLRAMLTIARIRENGRRVMREKTVSMEVNEAGKPFPRQRRRSFYPVNFMQTEPASPSIR